MHRCQQGGGYTLSPVRTRHAAARIDERREVLAPGRAFAPESQQEVADIGIAARSHDALGVKQRVVHQQLPLEVGLNGQGLIGIVFLCAHAAVGMQLLPLRTCGRMGIERAQCNAFR